jgi:2'-phosphotransferase
VVPVGDALTPETPGLPEFVVFETSYQRYPLLLAQGAITRAPGGGEYRVFVPVAVDAKDDEGANNTAVPGEAAEVSVWIHLRTAMEEEPRVRWLRSESGAIVTADDVPKSVWTRAVARRPDIGVLFEGGEVRKEVPASLRGKGAKGKARKGKAALRREGTSEEDSGSASEE